MEKVRSEKIRDGEAQTWSKSEVSSGMEQVRGEKIRDGEAQTWRKSEERRRCRCVKGRKVAKHCVFSNGLWLRRVEK